MEKKSRFKPLEPIHRQIGARLGYVRRYNGETQAGFAKRLSLTRDMLSNIENGRVPLRFDTAWNAAKTLDVHPDWLFTGRRELPFPALNPKHEKTLQMIVERQKESAFGDVWPAFSWIFWLPTEDRDKWLDQLSYGIESTGGFKAEASENKETKNESLTVRSENRNSPPNMKREITFDWLLAEICRLTEPDGMKAKLADYLGVPRSRVSEWLAGKYKPSVETAFKILHWVQNPSERK